VYALVGTIGGSIVILYGLGYLIVACLTVNAYEDHMVQTVYPTKETLKQRVKTYTAQFPETEQAKWSGLFEDDKDEPDLDVTRYGCLRCFCRCLFSQSGCCRAVLRCWRATFRCCQCCQQSKTEKMFDIGREFYPNEISVSRLVNAM